MSISTFCDKYPRRLMETRRLIETWRLFEQSANTPAFNRDPAFIGDPAYGLLEDLQYKTVEPAEFSVCTPHL